MRKKQITENTHLSLCHTVLAIILSTSQPNTAVQPDAAGAALTWARFTRQTAVAYYRSRQRRTSPAASW